MKNLVNLVDWSKRPRKGWGFVSSRHGITLCRMASDHWDLWQTREDVVIQLEMIAREGAHDCRLYGGAADHFRRNTESEWFSPRGHLPPPNLYPCSPE